MPLPFFYEMCGRIGNEMPRTRMMWPRKGGFSWRTNYGDAHPRDSVKNMAKQLCEWRVDHKVSGMVTQLDEDVVGL